MAKQVRLGKTDIYVNPVGLGANAIGGHNIYSNLDDEVGKDLVRTAFQHDINFIDTAYSYGFGRSEELIGEVVNEMNNRSDVIIATKGGPKLINQKIHFDNSPSFLKQEVEESLKRLKTDYIDIYYIHKPDKATPKAEAIGALKELKDEGKIRVIGVSNFSIDQLKEANIDGYIDVYQGGYHLLDRALENDIIPYTIENNISFIQFYPLAAGLLTGKFSKDSTFTDLRARLPYFKEETYLQNLEKVKQLRAISESKNVEMAHLVLAWYLTRDGIDSVIPGAKRPDQIVSNLKALDIKLTQKEIQEIDMIFKS
ncbi:aldo/keto reductase [Bacillus sp. JJ1521]|uniref:aldo/keto reductase n=1 Tax=Bacillus sp. JJ1521 TaxID=3122957 RepID=UPI0030004520